MKGISEVRTATWYDQVIAVFWALVTTLLLLEPGYAAYTLSFPALVILIVGSSVCAMIFVRLARRFRSASCYARLSLDTVTPIHRGIALILGFLTAMVMYEPSTNLFSSMIVPTTAIQRFSLGFEPRVVVEVFAPYNVGYVLLAGCVPGYAALHVALRWFRGTFSVMVIAGTILGMLSTLSISNLSLRFFSSPNRLGVYIFTIGFLCGGVGAAVAWSYMSVTHSRARSNGFGRTQLHTSSANRPA